MTEPVPSRRRFLVWGTAFAGAAAIAWQVQGRLPPSGLTEGHQPQAFRPWQFRTLRQACAVALDDPEAGRKAAIDLDAYFAGPGADQVADLALALGVLEFLPRGVRPRRFSRLTLEDAASTMQSWERSRVGVQRQIARALRDAARFTWFAREETWADMGYEGTWLR